MIKLSAVLGAILLVGACAPAQSRSGSGSSGVAVVPDTLIGVVSETGADPATYMAVKPNSGSASMRLTGDGATTLRAISNAEVWLSGARASDGFRVDAFEVRRANNQTVDDGIVSVSAAKVFLRTRSGAQREIPDAPPALMALSGARIWVTRPVANQAPSYGVIQKP